MTNHLHTSFESAYEAVRRGIAEREEKRRAEERAKRLLTEGDERPEMPEAPPRTGPSRRKSRREYDAKRNNWRRQVQSKVIDEDEPDEVEPPRDQVLHDAVAALRADDAEKFNRLVTLAIARLVNDEVADRKLAIAMEMFQSDEGDEED